MSTRLIIKSITDNLTKKSAINTSIIQEYNNDIYYNIPIQQAFKAAAQNANKATLQLISSANGGAVSEEALSNAMKKSAHAAQVGEIALKGLASAGSMIALWAVDKGIEMAVTALNNYIHRVDIARGKIQEISSSIDSSNQRFQSHAELLEEAKKSYSRLASGVNLADNTNLSLSNEDYETFLALNNELAEAFPQLRAGLDDQGNAILKLGANARSSSNDLQTLIEQEKELNYFQIAQDVPELFSNVKTVLTDSVQEISVLEKQLEGPKKNWDLFQTLASGNYTPSEENPFQLSFEYPSSDEVGLELSNVMSQAIQKFLKTSDLPNGDFLREALFSTDYNYSYDENGTPLFRSLLNTSGLTEKQRSELFRLIKEEASSATTLVSNAVTDSIGDMENQITLAKTQSTNIWDDFLPNLLYLTRSKQTYQNLDGDLQKLTEQVITSLDFSNVIQDIDTNDPYAYILEHIITPLQNLSKEQTLKISDLFSGELSQDEAKDLISQLQNTFKETGLEVSLNLSPLFEEQDTKKLSIPKNLARAQEKALSSLGVTFEDYAAIKQEAANSGMDLFEALDNEITLLAAEGIMSQETAAALFYYQLQKALANENGLNTAEDCANLLLLAENAGITGDVIQDLTRLEEIYQEVSTGRVPITRLEQLLAEADGLTASIKSQAANFKASTDSAKEYAGQTKDLAGAQRSAASASDRYTSALEAQKSALESQKSALEDQKQHYEDVIQAINWFYDKQIGKVQNLIDALEKENKLLEKRKGNYDMALSSIDRFYEREIQQTKDRQDAIQEKIDALKAENEEHQKSYELEKAAYELERARNQRTNQVYVQGKGMVYVTDDDAVREAENTYDNLLVDQQVSDLEKQKADLDLTIAKLEEYRQMWSEVSDSYQFAQQDMMMSQLLGASWESDLLNGRMETLSLFRDTYNEIQAEMNSNEQLIASYEEKIEYYQGLKDQWEELTGKYQEETYIQLLTSEFGNDYENELLNGRTGRWTKFSEDYAGIQRQLKDVTDQIETLAARMESYAARMEDAAARANRAANSINGVSSEHLLLAKPAPFGGGRARGGIISQKDSNSLDYLARSVGEDHLVPLQEGEAVIPRKAVRENSALIEALLSGNPGALEREHRLGDFPADRYPDLQKALLRTPFPAPPAESLNITEHTSAATLQFYGDLSFPNIHSGDDARKLVEELSRLSVRGRQYFERQ